MRLPPCAHPDWRITCISSLSALVGDGLIIFPAMYRRRRRKRSLRENGQVCLREFGEYDSCRYSNEPKAVNKHGRTYSHGFHMYVRK